MEEALIQRVREHATVVLLPGAVGVPERVAAALTSIEAVAAMGVVAVVVLLVELPVARCQQCSEPTSEP